MRITSLAYMGVETPESKQWAEFGPEVLGMGLADAPDAGTVLLRTDDRHHRLAVRHGERNRLSYLGWEVPTPEDLDQAAEELDRAGIGYTRGADDVLAARHVEGLLAFSDPFGFRHELAFGGLEQPGTFRPGRHISRFVTEGQGLGHAVLVVPELAAARGFYRSVLGFGLSDVIHAGFATLDFFHVNPRHHSLATMTLPGPPMKGLQHLMVEVGDIDDVGAAYDLCAERGHEITLTLGRHVNDRMVSFYVRAPGGFDVEYGYGAVAVDSATWTTKSYDRPSYWGHKFVGTSMPGALEPVDS
jgi:extradiol dioxygenase